MYTIDAAVLCVHNIYSVRSLQLCTQVMVTTMVKIGWTEDELELTEITGKRFVGTRKVGKHARKSKGVTYESPKIVLDRNQEDFIGKKYKTLSGKAVIKHSGGGVTDPWEMKGKCIVLFFPDRWNEE